MLAEEHEEHKGDEENATYGSEDESELIGMGGDMNF